MILLQSINNLHFIDICILWHQWQPTFPCLIDIFLFPCLCQYLLKLYTQVYVNIKFYCLLSVRWQAQICSFGSHICDHLCNLCLRDILPGITFCMYTCLYVSSYMHMHTYLLSYMHTYIYIHVVLPKSIHLYICTCLPISIHTYVQIHVSVYIYVCIYVY